MAVNLVVAITDYDWFQALRVREDWPEVNFWAPSGTNFRALFQERGRVASGSEELADSHTDAQDLLDEQR